jgi:hypothetical protein
VLIALNNIAVSREHTVKLKTDLEREAKKLFSTAVLTDQQKISSCLAELADTVAQVIEPLTSIGSCGCTTGTLLRGGPPTEPFLFAYRSHFTRAVCSLMLR